MLLTGGRGRRLAPRRWLWICQGIVRGIGGRTGRRLRQRRPALVCSAHISIMAEFLGQFALLAVAFIWIMHKPLAHRRLLSVSSVTRASHQACASAWVSKL